MENQYEEIREQTRQLAQKMRMGSGVSTLLQARESAHYADALERFQKDYASIDKVKRQQEKNKKQLDIQNRRLQYLERQNQRWEKAEQRYVRQKEREYTKMHQQMLGVRRTANSNGLAYNPINLSYDSNPQGEKLRTRDQDAQIRRFVRAHNMDHRGNSGFNPLNGGNRVGIQRIIPSQLTERYQQKLNNHYQQLRLKVPPHSSNNDRDRDRGSPRNYY